VSVLPFQNINQSLRITVLVSETDISDYQSTPQGKIADYKHKHVLRDVITAATGDNLGTNFSIATLVKKTYNYKIPSNWKADKCSIIAFVHREGTDKFIVNVAEQKIK
jgi:cell division ATPase FtsA